VQVGQRGRIRFGFATGFSLAFQVQQLSSLGLAITLWIAFPVLAVLVPASLLRAARQHPEIGTGQGVALATMVVLAGALAWLGPYVAGILVPLLAPGILRIVAIPMIAPSLQTAEQEEDMAQRGTNIPVSIAFLATTAATIIIGLAYLTSKDPGRLWDTLARGLAASSLLLITGIALFQLRGFLTDTIHALREWLRNRTSERAGLPHLRH
jgi:hypothetical protein